MEVAKISHSMLFQSMLLLLLNYINDLVLFQRSQICVCVCVFVYACVFVCE